MLKQQDLSLISDCAAASRDWYLNCMSQGIRDERIEPADGGGPVYRIVIALLLMFSYSRPTFPQTDKEQERITKSATEICSQHQDWTEAQCAKAAQLDERQRSLQELIAGLCAEHKDWTRDHCASVAGGDEEKRKIRAKVAEFDEQVAVVCAQHPGWTRAQCAEAAESGDIENVDGPLRYVLSHADETGEGFVAFDCSRCSAMKDLLFVQLQWHCVGIFYVSKNQISRICD